MKKAFFVVLLVCIVAGLFGCSKFSKTLSAPEGIRIEDGVLKWNSVDGAEEYRIFCDDLEIVKTKNTYYVLGDLDLVEGQTYNVTVRAFGDGYINLSSEQSASVSYEHESKKTNGSNVVDDKQEQGSKPEVITNSDVAKKLFDAGLGYGVNALTAKSAISAEGGYSRFFDEANISTSDIGKRSIGSSRSRATTREDISSEIAAVNAKLVYGTSSSASLAGMFTAGFSEKFFLGTDIRSELKAHQMYFILNMYVIGENYELLDYRQPKAYNNKLSSYVLNDLQDLHENKLTPDQFFNRYGTHLKMAISYGGMTEVYYSIFSQESLNAASVSTSLESKLNAGFLSTDIGAQSTTEVGVRLESEFMNQSASRTTNLHIESIGKKPSTYLTFDSFAKNYAGWVAQYDDESNYRIVEVADGGLVPIWTYFPAEYAAEAEMLARYFNQEATRLGNALAAKMTAPITEDKGDTTHFAGGHGTEVSPYLIAGKDHFINMMESENDGKYYVLKNDIDLGDWSDYGIYNWAAQKSNAPKSFKGIFDGGNHTVKYSIRIGKTTMISWALGLFPCTKSATIKNVKAQCDLQTYDPQNRKNKWDISNDDRAMDVMVGGLIGYANNTTVKNCSTTGTIKYNSDGGSNDTSVGGVIGYAKECLTITNCKSSASIYVRGCWIELGGVIGLVYKSEYSSLAFTGSRSSNEDWFLTGGTWANDLIGRTDYDILPE